MAGNNKVEIELRLLKQQFDSALRETRQEIQTTQDAFRYTGEQTKYFSDESDRLTYSLQKSTDVFNAQKEGLAKMSAQYEELAAAGQQNTIEGQQMAKEIEKQTHKYNQYANELYETQVAHTAFHSSLGQVGRGLSDVGQNLQTAGAAMSGFAQHLMPAAIGIAAAGKQSYDAFTGFESSLIGVQKTTNATDDVMERFGARVRELAKETPHTAEQINRVAEVGGQLGISMENLLPFAQTMLDLSVTTNLSLEEGSIKLAQLANVMRMPETEFQNLGSAIVDLGNNYATMEDDIVSMSHRLAGAGRVVNMSVGDVLGLATAAAQTGAKVESAGTNLSKTFLGMQMAVELAAGEMTSGDAIAAQYGITLADLQAAMEEGGDAAQTLADSVGMSEEDFELLEGLLSGNIANLEQWATAAGMSAEQFAAAFQEDAAGAFTALIENIAQMEQDGKSAAISLDELGITNERQRDIMLRLVGSYDKLGEAVEMGNRAFEENTALAEEAELRYASMESQMQMVKNRIHDTMIEIGSRLAPVLLDMMELVDGAIATWDGLSDSTKDFLVKGGALLALGTPFLFTFGRLTTAVGGLMKGLGGGALSLATFFAKLKVGAPLTTAVSSAMGPAAAKVAALGTAAGGAAGTGGAAAGVAGLLKGLTAVAAPWIGPAIAVGAAGFVAYKAATQEVIPEVDLFADKIEVTTDRLDAYGGRLDDMGGKVTTTVTKISEETKKALGGFLEVSEELDLELQKLFVMDPEITEARMESIEGLIAQEKQILLDGEQEKHDAKISLVRDLFSSSDVMSLEHEQEILERMENRKDKELSHTERLYDSIEAIIRRAYRQQRELTEEEEEEILRLKQEIQERALENLVSTEEEKLIIQARMDEFAERQNAETLGALLNASRESYEEQKNAAEESYAAQVNAAAQLLTAGEITETEYQGMIASAQDARDKIKSAAEEQMLGVLRHLRDNYPDVLEEINLNNGEIKTHFDNLLEALGLTSDGVDNNIDTMIESYEELQEETRRSMDKSIEKQAAYRRSAGTEFDEASQYMEGHMRVIDQLNERELRNKSATYTIRTNYTYHHEAPTGRMPGRASYASGVDFVPYSGVTAQLHYGERVLTRAENEKFSMASLDEVEKLVRRVQDSVNKMERRREPSQESRIEERPPAVVNVSLEQVTIQNDASYEEVSYRIGREVAKELGM